MKTYIIAALITVGVFLTGFYFNNVSHPFGGTGLLTQASCTASTSVETVVTTASQQILATSSRRAWATVQELSAGNRVSIAFRADKPVSSTAFFQTASASTSATFGLNTDFPYTGAVQASSSNASASILVTQCNF